MVGLTLGLVDGGDRSGHFEWQRCIKMCERVETSVRVWLSFMSSRLISIIGCWGTERDDIVECVPPGESKRQRARRVFGLSLGTD